MLTVAHRVTLGGAVHSGGSGRLVALAVDARLEVPVNSCRLTLAPAGGIDAAVDQPVTVELGEPGEETLVFTGEVTAGERGVARLTVDAAGSFRRLAAGRVNLLYEKSKAGDVVRDLAARFHLAAGTVDDGLELPTYALGAERSAWDELHRLALRCGFDLWADAEDRLTFTAYRPAATHECVYRVNVLDYRHEAHPPALSGVEVHGESPASHGQGAEAVSWLTKAEVKGTAGDASLRLERRSDPVGRTLELAERIAGARLAAASRTARGRVTVLGEPQARLGDAVRLAELPGGAANGTFKITGVRQVVDARQGHVTHLDWQAAPGREAA